MNQEIMRKCCYSLEKSICSGEIKKIEKLLRQLNELKTYADQPTLLHHLGILKRPIIVAYLIDDGYDINVYDYYKCTPLMLAVRHNYLETVDILLDQGAQRDHTLFDLKRGPLHIAASNGYRDMVKLLIKHGCDVNARDEDGETALQTALKARLNVTSYDRLETAKILIEAGSVVDETNSYGVPLLCFAAAGSVELAKLMLNSGIRINATDTKKRSALYYAAELGKLDTAKLLIESGADVHASDCDGNTCLHAAVQQFDPKMVELLLDHGASVTTVNNCGQHSFYSFLEHWRFLDWENVENFNERVKKCMKMLMESGVRINDKIHDCTPLDLAIERKVHSEIVRFLLENGATYNDKNLANICKTYESSKKKSGIPYLLIKHAAMTHIQDLNNQSSLRSEDFSKELYEYYVCCRNELKLMKETIIDDCVSFLNILVDKKIRHCTRNEKIVDELSKKSDIVPMFPIYGNLLIRRFEAEIERQKLLQEAADCLSHVIGWEVSAFPVIYDNILKYFTIRDLRKFNSIGKNS